MRAHPHAPEDEVPEDEAPSQSAAQRGQEQVLSPLWALVSSQVRGVRALMWELK